MPQNEENLFLYARLDITNKGLANLYADIKVIQKKLKENGSSVKLKTKLDFSVGEINKSISNLQKNHNFQAIKIPVQIDVKGTAKAVSDQLKTVKKVLDQWSNHQHQAQQKIQASVVNPSAVNTKGISASSYVQGVEKAKEEMKKAFDDIKTISSKAFTDAEGNLQGFYTTLDDGKGNVEKWKWNWQSLIEEVRDDTGKIADYVDKGQWVVSAKEIEEQTEKARVALTSSYTRLYQITNKRRLQQGKEPLSWEDFEARTNKITDGNNNVLQQRIALQNRDLAIQEEKTKEMLRQQSIVKNADYNKFNAIIKQNDIESAKKLTRELGLLNGEIGELNIRTDNEKGFSLITATAKGTGDTLEQVSYKINHLNKDVTKVSDSMVKNHNRNLGVMEQLKIAMARFPVWMLATTAYYGTARAIRAMASEIFELDKSLTELKRVANDGLNIDSLFKNTLKLSQDLGNNIHNVMDTVNEFARTFGEFNEEQLLAITRTATIMSNVSDLTTQEAGETLVGTMKAFNITAEESIRIVDSMNEVDNQYAISTKQIAEGMEKSASVAKTFGVSLEENIGNITSIGAVTQESGAIIGRK